MPTGVYIRTKPGWNKGLTKETDKRVAKQSEALKGRNRSEKTKNKISKTLIGHITSEETKEKISKGNSGKVRTLEIRKQWSRAHTGIKQSEETKRKRSKSMTGVGKGRKYPENLYPNRGMRGKSNLKLKSIPLSEEHLKNVFKGLSLRPTSLEKRFQEIVDKYNLPYKYVGDGEFILGGKCPDFINTNNEKIAIEVFVPIFKKWSFGTVKSWKRERSKLFKSFGWKIIYFEDKEVNDNFILRTLQEGLIK